MGWNNIPSLVIASVSLSQDGFHMFGTKMNQASVVNQLASVEADAVCLFVRLSPYEFKMSATVPNLHA